MRMFGAIILMLLCSAMFLSGCSSQEALQESAQSDSILSSESEEATSQDSSSNAEPDSGTEDSSEESLNQQGNLPTDVPSDAPYADAVLFALEIKMFAVDERSRFFPQETITRAELIESLYNLYAGEDARDVYVDTPSVFSDVPLSHVSYAHINWAVDMGYIEADGENDSFHPDDLLIIEDATRILLSIWGFDGKSEDAGGYPNGYLYVAEEESLLESVEEAQGQPLTRASLAQIFYNYYFEER